MRNFLLVAAAIISQAVMAAGGIYSWTDESGQLVFGDNPPDNVNARAIDPPELTVLEAFSSRYQPAPVLPKASKQQERAVTAAKKIVYTELKVIAPKYDQAIRANDGDVSVAWSLSPKLRSGDKVVIKLDGQEVSDSTSRVANLTNLDRGEHTLSLSVVSAERQVLIAAEPIRFHVLRHSVLLNKPTFNPYEQAKPYEQAEYETY
ncbi:MAG: hypothetical protein CSB47_05895 [Proteobacteria bacterium]|nr:MAG: hypothetical protein CSB47_05895 [Pseudomonadota bacterium]